MPHEEYLRRNLNVAKAIGAVANTRVALERLKGTKHPQKWLVAALEGILDRVKPLPHELANYRALAPDVPDYTKQHSK